MHSPSKSVLVVDDNATVRQALRRFFETRTSMKVWEARNGSEAIEQTKAQTPDFVIMDLVMPNMNGVEATVELPCREGQSGGLCTLRDRRFATERRRAKSIASGVLQCQDRLGSCAVCHCMLRAMKVPIARLMLLRTSAPRSSCSSEDLSVWDHHQRHAPSARHKAGRKLRFESFRNRYPSFRRYSPSR